MNPIKIVSISILAFAMAACGGGSPIKGSVNVDDTGVDNELDGETNITSISARNVTFLPVSILETSSEYSGVDEDNLFSTQVDYPYIAKKMLSVFDSKTLAATPATIDDFIITENDQVVDPLESFPILQTIGVIPTYLHTAIVIDTSGSVNSITLDAIIAETKEMIVKMQSSSDLVIKNQRFSIWAFGQTVQEITSGFTADTIMLNNALDAIATVNVGESSNLNQAIVEAIGNYDGSGGEGSSGDFSFRDTPGFNNDLIEEVTTDRIQLSSLILITSGTDTLNVFENDQVKIAIESQSQVVFDTAEEADSATVTSSVTKNIGKPFIVILVGDDPTISAVITDNASNVINLKDVTGELTYAEQVIGFQTDLIALRKRESARMVLRYASPKRQGTHSAVVSTSAVDFKYSLTSAIEFASTQTVGMPSEVYIPLVVTSVEIAGANNQYLQNVININDTNTFYPATRWTTNQFAISDYVWTLDGIVLPFDSTTGAVTINPASIAPSATLSLTNNAIIETKNILLTAGASPGMFIYDDDNNQPLAGQSIARADIKYVDLNKPDPDAEVDPTAPAVTPEEVYTVAYQDYNAPLESYAYTLYLPAGWVAFDASAPDGTAYDFKLFANRIQIEKQSIVGLAGPITITIENDTLATSASFTITL
jgi:hypothetical protein